MEKIVPQNFKKHARLVPLFHFVVAPILLYNVVWRIVILAHEGVSTNTISPVLVAIALVGLAFAARNFALSVQDRLICFEMETRLQLLLPPDLRVRIPEFAPNQRIALRFAGDDELPTLARQVLDENLTDRKVIKSRIRNWRPDYMRC